MAVVYNFNEPAQISAIIDLLKSGTPVALPTETVYGLAAPFNNETALAKIFALKARPTFDPLIVHVLSWKDVKALVKKTNPIQKILVDAFWPGPLTILFEKSDAVPALCTANTDWVAIRSPQHKCFRTLLESLGIPLAAPSANRYGKVSPTEVQHVLDELGPFGLEAVVDGGNCERGLESTIVKIIEGENAPTLQVLRPGACTVESLKELLGTKCTVIQHKKPPKEGKEAFESPGQGASHYATKTPLFFVQESNFLMRIPESEVRQSILICVFNSQTNGVFWQRPWLKKIILSSENNEAEAAAKLFSVLRNCDKSKAERIVALSAPEIGLGIAINDRLSRASHDT